MDLLQWIAMSSRLASLTRFSMERLVSRESVLEHIGQVALTSYAIALEVDARAPGSVDVADVVARALCHDLDEVITGDIARPTKHSSPEAAALFQSLAVRSIEILAADLDASVPRFAARMKYNHRVAKTGPSGAIVGLADILAVVAKVWEETILRANGAMIRQAHTATAQLVAYQLRISVEFKPPAANFLHAVVASAIELMAEAKRRDSAFYATRVEVYDND
jgi:5'-deoxynucleotidase YfbR-like HD superfamily hydrolase